MGDSIRELKAILDAKGGNLPTLSTEDLQALRTYIMQMIDYRLTGLPSDSGQSRSGTDCTALTGSDPPSSPLSISDLDDWQVTGGNLPGCSCDAQTYTAAYCPSRITVYCESRTNCACKGRTTDCTGYTRCACNEDNFNCANYNNPGCVCDGRSFLTCLCKVRVNCGSRTTRCSCDGRNSYCSSRTACACNTQASCTCDTRCSCNTVDVFS